MSNGSPFPTALFTFLGISEGLVRQDLALQKLCRLEAMPIFPQQALFFCVPNNFIFDYNIVLICLGQTLG